MKITLLSLVALLVGFFAGSFTHRSSADDPKARIVRSGEAKLEFLPSVSQIDVFETIDRNGLFAEKESGNLVNKVVVTNFESGKVYTNVKKGKADGWEIGTDPQGRVRSISGWCDGISSGFMIEISDQGKLTNLKLDEPPYEILANSPDLVFNSGIAHHMWGAQKDGQRTLIPLLFRPVIKPYAP